MTDSVFPVLTARVKSAMAHRKRLVGVVVLIVLALLLLELFGAAKEPEPAGGPPMVRRLTEAQYRASIADIFAADIPVNARFEKPLRADGLIAVGTGMSGMSPFAVEQYDAAAQGIAAAVLSGKHRRKFLTCGPSDGNSFDAGCARDFLSAQGRLLFRRPLTSAEADKFVDLAGKAHRQLGSFHQALELSLYTMLVSPEFLFRI
jgi:hypothetical protein